MLERDIEKRVNDYAKAHGVLVYKFTSPNRAAVPDRLYVFPNGTVVFIEFKRQGAVPTPPQQREHTRLRGHNVPVYVVDNPLHGNILIDHIRDHDAKIVPDTSWWL